MPMLLRNVYLNLDEPEAQLPARAAKRLRIPESAIRTYAIVGRSLDARRGQVRFCYQLEIALDEPPQREKAILKRQRPGAAAWLEPKRDEFPTPGTTPIPERPVIIGFGPGGMFAALRLAEMGYRPIVLERGREVRRRHRDIMQRYYREHDFDPTSNLLFGEGGAGTYSDGKLYTRVHDPLCRHVLEVFYQHGADPDILIDTRPHIGSDRLPTICTRIRQRIEALGGEVRFESRLNDLRIEDGTLKAIRIGDAGDSDWVNVGPVILAIGHSARDTLNTLAGRGVRIDAKPFQIGVRIEHPQALVDGWQYGAVAGHERLAAAEYHLVAKGAACERGDMFSFCMCPGGEILPTNESAGLIATNGASRANRSGPFANAGLVITMDPAAMGLTAMEAVTWQEKWERLAYEATNGSYAVPCQRASDFLGKRPSDGTIETSFPLGGQWHDLRAILPQEVADALIRALPTLDSRMPGFAGTEAIITAPETRASAPVRITRDSDSRCAISVDGLYPVGEGAGYAGGIVSAAIDGIRAADAIITRFARSH